MHEGEYVRAGQVLVVLDPAPFEYAVQQAEAQLLQTALNPARHAGRLPPHPARHRGARGGGAAGPGDL